MEWKSIIFWFYLSLFIGMLFLVFFVWQSEKECERRGGVSTRAGCLRPEIFK